MHGDVVQDAAAEVVTDGLLAGKRGLVLGVANSYSIAWGIAQAARAAGADLAITYQGDAFRRRVEPLAGELGAAMIAHCDVEDPASLDALFERIGSEWGKLDFLVHAIAFSDKEELKGRYVDTTLDNFLRTMRISCFSFTDLARRCAPLMAPGGSMLTLSYIGAERVMPSYNVMGVAKAALEASVRYIAADLGRDGIRANAISAGPMRTLAGSAIADARYVYRLSQVTSPLRRNVLLSEIGGTAVYLLSDLAGAVTGQTHYVDCGFHAVGMPPSGSL
ncbi:MAG: SDR family oxidoreductase [Rhodospirillaceae bacterium]|nr:SDR family oxidoreductase [Rhodospirillaceae bacterium]